MLFLQDDNSKLKGGLRELTTPTTKICCRGVVQKILTQPLSQHHGINLTLNEGKFTKKCANYLILIYESFKHRQTPNSSEEPVLDLRRSFNLAKNQFYMVS